MKLFKSCMNFLFFSFFLLNKEDILKNVGNQTAIDFNEKENSYMEVNGYRKRFAK